MQTLRSFNVVPAWFQCTAIAFTALPWFTLGNKASNPNAVAIMLLWWSKLTKIFTLR